MSKRLQGYLLPFVLGIQLAIAGTAIPGSVKTNAVSIPKDKGNGALRKSSCPVSNWHGTNYVDSLTEADLEAVPPTGKRTGIHVYAILSRIPSSETVRQMEEQAGLKLVSVHGYDTDKREHVIYVASLNGVDLKEARKRLFQRFRPYFFNLIPIDPIGKLSRKMYQGTDFRPGEKDENGRINVAIRFFPDVPQKTSDSLITAYFGKAFSRDGGLFLVKGEYSNLVSLSEVDIIQYIEERDTADVVLKVRLTKPFSRQKGDLGEGRFDALGRMLFEIGSPRGRRKVGSLPLP